MSLDLSKVFPVLGDGEQRITPFPPKDYHKVCRGALEQGRRNYIGNLTLLMGVIDKGNIEGQVKFIAQIVGLLI